MDAYFLNPLSAYEQAKKQERTGLFNDLQICYYHGTPLQTDLENLIHLPLENIYDFMCETPYRTIKVCIRDKEVNENLYNQIIEYITSAQTRALGKKLEFVKLYKEEIQKIKLDFNKPLRIFFLTSRVTTVLQHTADGLMKAFQDLGYETFFSIEHNDMETWGTNQETTYFGWHLKNMLEFKPHITINLDYLHNDFLPEEMFNFVWFQDTMPFMKDNKQKQLRKRDFVFHLIRDLKQGLSRVGIESEYQGFLINENIFKKRPEIKKEKKIVFIGSSYAHNIEHLRSEKKFEEIFNAMILFFEKKSYITNLDDGDQKHLAKELDTTEEHISLIYNYLSRDYCVEKLCKINTGEYKVEVYGTGWEKNKYVSKFHKGMASYGEELSKIYNSATYGYCVGTYILMQRTLECAFSGTIPLVLDVRGAKQDIYDIKLEDSLQFFQIKDLEKILNTDVQEKKDFSFLQQEYSYKKMANKILDKVKKELSKGIK